MLGVLGTKCILAVHRTGKSRAGEPLARTPSSLELRVACSEAGESDGG